MYEQDCLRQQPNFQKLFWSLNLFEDCQNISRLKGKFGNLLLEYDQKYPIILHGYESLFTRLLIANAHQRSLHKGIEFTLNCVRSGLDLSRKDNCQTSFERLRHLKTIPS